jgi:hypothetical protein
MALPLDFVMQSSLPLPEIVSGTDKNGSGAVAVSPAHLQTVSYLSLNMLRRQASQLAHFFPMKKNST